MSDKPSTEWPHGTGEMAERIRSFDWSTTTLGPVEGWPVSLKTVVDLSLASPLVSTIALGDDRLLIYNDVAARLYGERHPSALGRPLAATFADSYPVVAPLYDRVFAGEPVQVHAQPLAVGTTGDGEVFDAYLTPIRDFDGVVVGAYMVGLEIGGKARAEATLRESEARFHAFVTAGTDAVYRMGPDWSEMRRLEGRAFLADTEEPSGNWLNRYLYPKDQPVVRAAIDRAIGTKSTFELEHRVIRADGSLGWVLSRAVPILTDGGEIAEWLGSASDVTERKTAEEALRASEELRREFGEASTDVLWIREAETLHWTYLTPAFETIYGLPREDALGGNDFRTWTDLIVPEDRQHAVKMIRRVQHGERVTFEYRVRRPSDGTIRWLRNTDFPIRDAKGRVHAIGGVGHDATKEKEAEAIIRESEAQLQVMVAELHHRTRNVLGIAGMIMRQTVASSTSLDHFRTRFSERLEALSRVQSLLSRKGDERIVIGDIVRIELDALGADLMSERVRIDGEPVALRKSAVQTLSLAIHELATNARKYGALSGDGGTLAARWEEYRTEADKLRLRFIWTETGIEAKGKETEGPVHKGGYGRMLIEEALPYTLKAETTYTLGKERLDCTIDMPLEG